MARTYSAEYVTKLKLDYQEATKNLDEFQREYSKLEKQVKDQNNATAKSIKNIEKSSGSAAKGIKGIGNALKAAGIGLAIAAFAKLTEVFNQNQKVADFFNTTFEVLSLTFNDFFNFLDRNIGTVTGYFKAIFNDPVQSINNFGKAIYENIIERVKSSIEALGFLGQAVVKVFKGDFAGAAESAKEAGKELLDVVTGIDDSFDKAAEVLPDVVKGIKEYAQGTIETATNMVELNKQARLNEVINQGLIEKYDRQAEQQRQIRDDETKTIQERIAANEKLGNILDEQEKKMLENAKTRIETAKLELSKNKDNIDAQIELQAALNESAAIEAQIEGFRSEQLMNINSLERERQDLIKENLEKEAEAEAQRLDDLEKRAANELKITEQVANSKKNAVEQAISLFGAETAAGKAALIAKQILGAQEMIAEARKTITFSSLVASRSAAAVAEGTAQTAKIGFPQNIPMLIGYGLQAAGIISAIAGAVGKSKSVASSLGGGGGGSIPQIQAPQVVSQQAPDFNVVGASGMNQLAETIAGAQARPQRAYVVANDVTTAQGLDRNIVEGASI